MYIPLILFFTSLFSIIVMITRKLPYISMEGAAKEQIPFELPYLKEIRENTVRNVKKHGYATLVITIRWYLRGANFLKTNYESAKRRVRRFSRSENAGEKKEISKFLRTVGEYKQKIRDIKHRISKEESL